MCPKLGRQRPLRQRLSHLKIKLIKKPSGGQRGARHVPATTARLPVRPQARVNVPAPHKKYCPTLLDQSSITGSKKIDDHACTTSIAARYGIFASVGRHDVAFMRPDDSPPLDRSSRDLAFSPAAVMAFVTERVPQRSLPIAPPPRAAVVASRATARPYRLPRSSAFRADARERRRRASPASGPPAHAPSHVRSAAPPPSPDADTRPPGAPRHRR